MSEFKNYKFINGNINDKQIIEYIIKKYSVDNIIHFAAESHVDNSINSPEIFIDTNIKGTFNLLETIRELWDNKGILDESKIDFVIFQLMKFLVMLVAIVLKKRDIIQVLHIQHPKPPLIY